MKVHIPSIQAEKFMKDVRKKKEGKRAKQQTTKSSSHHMVTRQRTIVTGKSNQSHEASPECRSMLQSSTEQSSAVQVNPTTIKTASSTKKCTQ